MKLKRDEVQDADLKLERGLLIKSLDRRFSSRGIRERRKRKLIGSNGWLFWLALLTGLKRFVDFDVALALLILLSLPMLALYALAKSRGGGIVLIPHMGRWAAEFNLYQISFHSSLDRTALVHLPTLVNVLKGDLSLIGPRAVPAGSVPAERSAWRRYQVRPGLLCLWWIRRRANIDYSNEAQVDAEYVDTQSIRGDLGIALRAIPATFYGEGVSNAPDTIHLAGIAIRNLTMNETLEYLVRSRRESPAQLCFVNADCVNIACRKADYMSLLHNVDMVVADGIGIKIAGKILNTHLRQNVNGTDLFPRLCERLESTGQGLFLLGGRPGVPEEVAAWIARNHPGARVKGFQHGFFEASKTDEIVAAIRESGAEILLVAFGAPKQDLWIQRYLSETGVNVAMGVGGLFDFYSGRIPRAPVWLREIGGEWLYRFIQEPRRMWRRYFVGNVVFLFRVFQYRAKHRVPEAMSPGEAKPC